MNKKEKFKIFFVYLAISFLIGGIFYKVVYSSDAYTIIAYGLEDYNKFALGNMRPLQYIITNIFMYFFGNNIRYEIIYIVFLSFSLLLIAISMYFVYTHIINILNKNEKIQKLTKLKKSLIFISIIFMFFNIYLSDNLVYLENFTMILALFLSVVASIIYTKNIKYKSVICLVLLVISEFLYQTMITSFVVLSLLFYALQNNKKIDIRYLIKLSIFFIIPLLLLFVFSKINIEGITVNSRYAHGREYIAIILNILLQIFIYSVVNILYFLLISVVLGFTKICKDNKYIDYNIFFIILTSVIYTYSFAIINKGAISNRMAWCIGALFSIISLYITVFREDVNIKKKRYIFVIVTTLIIEISLYLSLYFVYVRYNKTVEKNAKYVINYIDEYNSLHDKKIEKIALYSDDNITEEKWFSIVPYLAIDIYNVEDEFYGQVKIFSNSKISYSESDEKIYEKYFRGKDWYEFNSKQFIVIDSTLHFCKY